MTARTGGLWPAAVLDLSGGRDALGIRAAALLSEGYDVFLAQGLDEAGGAFLNARLGVVIAPPLTTWALPGAVQATEGPVLIVRREESRSGTGVWADSATLDARRTIAASRVDFDLLRSGTREAIAFSLGAWADAVVAHPTWRTAPRVQEALAIACSLDGRAIRSVQELSASAGFRCRESVERAWSRVIGAENPAVPLKWFLGSLMLLKGLYAWLARRDSTWTEVAATLRISERTLRMLARGRLNAPLARLDPGAVARGLPALERDSMYWAVSFHPESRQSGDEQTEGSGWRRPFPGGRGVARAWRRGSGHRQDTG